MTTVLPHDFHSVISQWWTGRFDEPTEARFEGWKAIRRGDDTVIGAPSGSGKTLAAFLTAIDARCSHGARCASRCGRTCVRRAREAAVLAGRRAPPPPSPFISRTRH